MMSEEEEEKNGRDGKFSEQADGPTASSLTGAGSPAGQPETPDAERAEMVEWLVQAGVGPYSHKLGKLLRLGLSLAYVKAWSLYYQWWHREKERAHGNKSGEMIDGRRRFSTGTLIRVLEDGDPAPPMRCEDCLALLPCYCDMVQR